MHTPFLFTSSLAHRKGGATHPSESDMYVCDVCNQSFSTQGSPKDHLERHMKVHRPAVEVRRDLPGISADATVDLPPSPLPPSPSPKKHGETPVFDVSAKSFASLKMLKRL